MIQAGSRQNILSYEHYIEYYLYLYVGLDYFRKF